MKADRSKATDLFALPGGLNVDIFNVTSDRNTKPSQKSKTQSKGIANANNRARMLEKLEDELFNEFNEKDWFQYFVMKAEEHGIKYLVRNYAKDYTIIKSILNELSWDELKTMIDFVWDSNQDIVDKRTVGIWVLSKGWINTIYQNSVLWKEGQYKPKSAPSRNREWVAEASSKPVETNKGLKYGKPIKEEKEAEVEKETSVIPKKSRITLGRKRKL